MTQETVCPACGAPLVYSENQEVVRCTFCGAEIKVMEEDEQTNFQVLSQPEPQKEVLNQPVEGAGNQLSGAQMYPATPSVEPPNSEEPSPPQTVRGSGAAYPVEEERITRSNINRWVWVSIAILVGLAVLCTCALLALLAVIPGRIH